jgi:hypothetical protein
MPRYREDDEDDRRRRPRDEDDRLRPASGGGNTTVTIMLILGGVFVLIALICGGVALYIYTSVARGVNEVQQRVEEEQQRTAKRMQEEHAETVRQMEADQKRMREESDRRMRDAQAASEKDRQEFEKRRRAIENRTQAKRAVEAFLAEVRANRIEESYKLTTAGFQARVRLDEFRTLADIFVRTKDRVLTMRADSTSAPDGKPVTFTSFGGRQTSAKMSVIREGDRWLIDQFTVEKK